MNKTIGVLDKRHQVMVASESRSHVFTRKRSIIIRLSNINRFWWNWGRDREEFDEQGSLRVIFLRSVWSSSLIARPGSSTSLSREV
jgi:hypothetical protein